MCSEANANAALVNSWVATTQCVRCLSYIGHRALGILSLAHQEAYRVSQFDLRSSSLFYPYKRRCIHGIRQRGFGEDAKRFYV